MQSWHQQQRTETVGEGHNLQGQATDNNVSMTTAAYYAMHPAGDVGAIWCVVALQLRATHAHEVQLQQLAAGSRPSSDTVQRELAHADATVQFRRCQQPVLSKQTAACYMHSLLPCAVQSVCMTASMRKRGREQGSFKCIV